MVYTTTEAPCSKRDIADIAWKPALPAAARQKNVQTQPTFCAVPGSTCCVPYSGASEQTPPTQAAALALQPCRRLTPLQRRTGTIAVARDTTARSWGHGKTGRLDNSNPHLGVIALPDVEDGLEARQEAVLQVLRREAQQPCAHSGTHEQGVAFCHPSCTPCLRHCNGSAWSPSVTACHAAICRLSMRGSHAFHAHQSLDQSLGG